MTKTRNSINGRKESKVIEQINKSEIICYDERILIPMAPIVDEPFKFQEETLLHSRYYGDSMAPTLKPGDMVLLRKRKEVFGWGEIYMIQTINGFNIFCRPQPGETEDCIYIKYDNPAGMGGVEGQEVPKKYITGIWELVTSQRVHSQTYYMAQIPLFNKQ